MKEKSEIIRERLANARRHKKKWPIPEGAVIVPMHFRVYRLTHHALYHAEATVELWPTDDKAIYASISASAKTRADALVAVIEKIESSHWFHYMRKKGVRFGVTGAGMEELYKGYL